jgi:hypothetical protein
MCYVKLSLSPNLWAGLPPPLERRRDKNKLQRKRTQKTHTHTLFTNVKWMEFHKIMKDSQGWDEALRLFWVTVLVDTIPSSISYMLSR